MYAKQREASNNLTTYGQLYKLWTNTEVPLHYTTAVDKDTSEDDRTTIGERYNGRSEEHEETRLIAPSNYHLPRTRQPCYTIAIDAPRHNTDTRELFVNRHQL